MLDSMTIISRNQVTSLFVDGRILFHTPTDSSWRRILRIINTSTDVTWIIFAGGPYLSAQLQHLE